MSCIIILIALILFTYFSWRKPPWGIYAVIFSLPLYFWKFNILNIPFTTTEAMIYILALIFLLKKRQEKKSLFIKEAATSIAKNLRANPLLFFGLVFLFGGAVLATMVSSETRTSAGILKGWFFAPFLFFLIFVSATKEESVARRSLCALALSGAATAFTAIIYWLAPESAGVTYDGRLRAFYLSANHLAMYLAPAVLIIFNFQFSPKKSLWLPTGQAIFNKFSNFKFTKQIYPVFLFFLILFAFYHTYSFGAWLGVFTAIIFVLAVNYWLANKKKSNFIYIAVLLIFLAGIIFSQANADKFKNMINFSYPSISSRAVIWRVAGDILKDNWAFGIGPGVFQNYYLKKQADYLPYPEWAVPQPHNIFLAFWLQTGIMGLIGFLMILGWFFKTGVGILKNQKYGNKVIASFRQSAEAKQSRGLSKTTVCLATICLAIMIYTIIHGLTDTTYWKNDLALIFWLIIGIMFALKQKNS